MAYLTLLGTRFYHDKEDKRITHKLFELSYNRFGFAFTYSLGQYESAYHQLHIHLFWLNLFLTIPFFKGHADFEGPNGEEASQYGFSFLPVEASILFHLGQKVKIWDLPWSKVYAGMKVMLKDGSWIKKGGKDALYLSRETGNIYLVTPTHPMYRQINHDPSQYSGEFKSALHQENYVYIYQSENYGLQKVTASVTIEIDYRRYKWLRWTSLFQITQKYINVTFSEGIGDYMKHGGTIGCNYQMQKGETPLQALRRMERERTFL